MKHKHPSKVCQNCTFSNNKKGLMIRLRFRKGIRPNEGYWHIYCERKRRMFRWDKRKRCFIKKRY